MINQQTLLNEWIEEKIKLLPHTKELIDKAVQNKELVVEDGHINMSTDFIKKFHHLEKIKV